MTRKYFDYFKQRGLLLSSFLYNSKAIVSWCFGVLISLKSWTECTKLQTWAVGNCGWLFKNIFWNESMDSLIVAAQAWCTFSCLPFQSFPCFLLDVSTHIITLTVTRDWNKPPLSLKSYWNSVFKLFYYNSIGSLSMISGSEAEQSMV